SVTVRIMRQLVLLVAFCCTLAACTKKNPDLCCNDAADCSTVGLSAPTPCSGELLCRGNQCVAETCLTGSDCDAAAAFCDPSSGTCVEQCTQDTQCPGFGGNPDAAFCVAGSCVECRLGMTDCSGTTPVCDANTCRGC